MTAPAFSPARRAFLRGHVALGASSSSKPVAAISARCLARNGIACFSCRDACGERAIIFQPAIGGAQPIVIRAGCTGCGECIAPCPVAAVTLAALEATDG
jgi:ferredoxin-type protein NapF